jgi:hypothetical protein
MKIMLTREEFNKALKLDRDLMESPPVRSVETWTTTGVIYMSTEPLSAAQVRAGVHPVSSITLSRILELADRSRPVKQEPVQKEANQIEPD